MLNSAQVSITFSVSFHGCSEVLQEDTIERSVELGSHDFSFSEDSPLSFQVPTKKAVLCAKVYVNDDTLHSDPRAVQCPGEQICLLLFDGDDNPSGRVHIKVKMDGTFLEISTRLVAQLQVVGNNSDVLVPKNWCYEVLWLVFFSLYLGVGVAWCCLYLNTPLLESWYFCVSVLTVTGLWDILEDIEDDDVNIKAAQLFLTFYTVFGVIVLFTFLEACFEKFVDAVSYLLDVIVDNICPCQLFQDWDFLENWYIGRRRSRGYIMWLLLMLFVGTVCYHVLEEWDILQSAYYSVNVMVTVAYSALYPETKGGKIFTICWMPFSTLFVFFVLGDYVSFKNDIAKNHLQKQLLSKSITTPADLAILADEEGKVSKYAYAKYILTRSGSIDADEMDAIEESFDNLDLNGDGSLMAAEIRPKDISYIGARTEAQEVNDALALHRILVERQNAEQVSDETAGFLCCS